MDSTTPTPLTLPLSAPSPRPPRPLTAAPRVSVVIVNYRDWSGTASLVRQLLKTSGPRPNLVEVVVVDNHSPADPLMHRLRRWPRVSLRRWGRNRGFARAVNEGCRLSRGDWVLLLNPDVSVPAGFVEGVLALAQHLDATQPRAGVVGFQLQNPDGSPQLSAGPFPTLTGTLARLVLPRARKYQAVDAPGLCEVPWVTGCCLLLRRECVRELGGFDPAFFLYYEDVDFCRRARARGWSVWYEPRLAAVHHAPLHTRRVPPPLRAITRHALLTYCRKHWPAWQQAVVTALVQVEARLRQWWARQRGDDTAATQFGEVAGLVRELRQNRPARVRRHLVSLVRQLEESPCPSACRS